MDSSTPQFVPPMSGGRLAKPIMIQGTMSNVGKSIIAAGLCRIFSQDGYAVAPFKSQNMALNSFITVDGGEMGRAQVVQAEACGKAPVVEMNPVLLKPMTDSGSQVIVLGQSRGVMSAAQYFATRSDLLPEIHAAYQRLASVNDIIVIEGAGSPAEINLRHGDIVNMGLAQLVDAPVLLVGDINRGGVFAQLVGTCALLAPEELARVKALIINQFRGDVTLLGDGLRQLEDLTKRPVIGVVPHLDLDLDDEDCLAGRLSATPTPGRCDVAVIRLPKLSNFSDFTALGATPDLSIRYVDTARRLGKPDLVILPGTRNTIADLAWLRATGLASAIGEYARRGGRLVGICGGYQMLGQQIADPEGLEGGGQVDGLGLLPVTTCFRPAKQQTRVAGQIRSIDGAWAGLSGVEVEGYEIHLGQSRLLSQAQPLIRLQDGSWDGCQVGNVVGSYLHGLFDTTAARQGVRRVLGLPPVELTDYRQYRHDQLDHLAAGLRAALDLDQIYQIMGVRR